MSLRVDEGVDIPIRRSPSREQLSGFINKTTTILPVETDVAPGEQYGRLGIDTISQRPLDMWCWAACVAMVSRFLGAPVEKCRVAGSKLERECCGELSEQCDTGLSVEDIGRAFGAARLAGNLFNKLSFEKIKARIDGDPARGIPPSPVVAGIVWQGGGGHLIVISGWRIAHSLRFVKVNDPFYASGDIRYEDLESRYGPNDNGRWLHTWTDFRRV